ncbi:unnamed protein product [Sphagnum tenellum]
MRINITSFSIFGDQVKPMCCMLSFSTLVIRLYGVRKKRAPIKWPLLGSLVEVLWNYHRYNDWLVPYLQKASTMRVDLPAGLTYTYTVDPLNVEHILKNNFANYPKGDAFKENMHIFLGDGIFNADGEEWRRQRKTASFEFSSKILRDFSTVVFKEYTLNLAAILDNAATAHQAVDMQDLFMRMTLDAICKISFGVEMGSLAPSLPTIPFAKAFETTNEIVTARFVDPLWKLKRFLNVSSEATVLQSAKEIDDFVYNVIRTRRIELKELQQSQNDILKRKDLFTRFLLLNEEGTETYTDKNLRDTMLNFVIAGRDTTAVTLSWFVYMICSHPDVADKIHEELCAFEKEREKEEQANFNHSVGISLSEDTLSNFSHRVAKFSQHLTYESLLKLQYLHAAILETLRLYPAVPLDPKGVIADDLLPDGTKVKKGSLVVYVAYAMGRMTALWGADACDFKPERWLKDGVVQPESPFKFTAFQAGPRICLGKDSAMLQLKMATSILCRFFKFQVFPGFPVKFRQMSTLLLAGGLKVTVTKRMT